MYGIDVAISILEGPDLSENRRNELRLARRMALAINVLLNGGSLEVRIETAKDLIHELKCVYPEIGGI